MSQLGEAYSILGQATTAEYKRRRKEEEEYRRRARRDQLLGYVLAPIGAEIGKGVSDIISAPFKNATEKFLATEQGYSLSKDVNMLNSYRNKKNALDKLILEKHGGDANAYHLGLAEAAIKKDVRSQFLSLGYSEKQLDDKNTDVSRSYNQFLQEELKKAQGIADRETEEYVAFGNSLSGYKTGEDAKQIIRRHQPYASGPLGGILNVGKRLVSGVSFSEAIAGPTKAEKEKAVLQARQALNLTEEEFAALSSKAQSGLSFARLDKEIDRIATSKNPNIEQLRLKQKRDDELALMYSSGELPNSLAINYRRYVSEKDRRPGWDDLLFYIEKNEGIDSIGFTEQQRNGLLSQIRAVPSVVKKEEEFKASVLKDLGYNDPQKAPAQALSRADQKWNNILDSALYSAQLGFAASSDVAPEKNNPILLMSDSDKRMVIIQNAVDKLSFLEREPAEEQGMLGKLVGAEYIPTPGRFTGAFNFDAVKTASPESAASQVSTQAAPISGLVLDKELEQDIIRTVASGDEAGAARKIKLLEEAGFQIPIALKNFDFISIEEEPTKGQKTVYTTLGPLSYDEKDVPKQDLPETVFTARGAMSVPKKTQQLEPVEGPTTAQRMDSLLADIGVGERDLEPAPRTSFESSPSSFVAAVERRTNKLDVPNVRTKEGRGIVSKMKQEVKEQLGVELSRKETQQVIGGLIDPSKDQIQGILDILSKRPPIKGMNMEPSEEQLTGILRILEDVAPAKKADLSLLSDSENLDIDRQIAKGLADDIKSLRGFSSMNRKTIEERLANMNVSAGIKDLALQFIFE